MLPSSAGGREGPIPAPCQESRYSSLIPLLILAILPIPLLGSTITGSQVLAPSGQFRHFSAWSGPTGETPAWDILYWDDLCQLLPWQAEAQRSLQNGRAPLWNHGAACGSPLLANTQTSALSPVWLLFQFGGILRAQGWLAWFQLWLAGAGTYLFLRRYHLGQLPALFGALAYELSGWSLCWLEFPNRHAPVAWFPVCLWLLSRALSFRSQERMPIRAASAAAAVAISLLSGHLQFEFYLLLGLGIYVICGGTGSQHIKAGSDANGLAPDGLVADDARSPVAGSVLRWRLTVFAAVIGLALLLALPQILPSMELGRWSPRQQAISWTHYSDRMHFAMPVWWLAQAWLPGLFGFPSRGDVISFVEPGPVLFYSANFYEFCVVVGAIPLLLAVNGIRQWKRAPVVPFLGIIGGVSLLMATGSLLNAPLYFGLPGFSAITGTARMLFLFAFAMAGLAAVGVEALATSDSPLPWRQAVGLPLVNLAIVAVLGTAFCASAVVYLSSIPGGWRDSPLDLLAAHSGECVLTFSLVAAATGVHIAARLWPAIRHWGTVLLTAGTAVQLLSLGTRIIQVAPRDSTFPMTPTIAAIQAKHPFRTMGVGARWTVGPPLADPPEHFAASPPLPPNTGLYYGIASLESYDSLMTRAYRDYVESLQGGPPTPGENGNMVLLSRVSSPPVVEAGVDLVVSPVSLEGPVLRDLVQPAGRAGSLYLYHMRHPRPPAYLVDATRVRVAGRSSGAPRISRWAGGEIRIEGVAGPGELVVLDSNVPGWSAWVDGIPASIRTRAGLFKSIHVGAGTHRVTLEYRPLSFRLGVFLSSLGVAALMAISGLAPGRRHHGRIEASTPAPDWPAAPGPPLSKSE